MANPNKARGTAWETAIVNYLRDTYDLDARRRPLTGNADQGDITVEEWRAMIIQAKAWGTYDLAGWTAAADTQADNAQVPFGIVWAKRRGKTSPADGYVIMTGATFAEITATIAELTDRYLEAQR